MQPVILSGGAGSRLWPLSREGYPKQLLPLVSEKTLLQETLLRLNGFGNESPIIVCHEDHRFIVAEQCRAIDIEKPTLILESIAKNTAPATALAALFALAKGEDPILLVLPADHVIQDLPSFLTALEKAQVAAALGYLVTFGVQPDYPETGYGYIKIASAMTAGFAFRVAQFTEKPNQDMAKQYIESGQYYWNSGIFMFRASLYLNELKKYAPDIFDACQIAIENKKIDLDFIRLNKETMALCPADSIDYAVMEKTTLAAMVPLEAGWSDIGSWSSLWAACAPDEDGNVLRGDVQADHVTGCYLQADSRLLSVLGVSDHIIIETPDAVLVVHKDYSQSVKNIVTRLKQQGRTEAKSHRRIYRPWGYYETVDFVPSRFQVKRITVKSGAILSLQMHYYRSEHWVVVSGIAEVTRGEDIFILNENESTYIPVGTKHRLKNVGTVPLEIIEVQSGIYLGEDDIVRFEDVYGREELVAGSSFKLDKT